MTDDLDNVMAKLAYWLKKATQVKHPEYGILDVVEAFRGPNDLDGVPGRRGRKQIWWLACVQDGEEYCWPLRSFAGDLLACGHVSLCV
jgi:hypothetical protein